MIATVFSIGLTATAYAAFLTPVQIIDVTGDGSGTILGGVTGVATDSSGNVFVAGSSDSSNSIFKITPSGTITLIIDITGDGLSPHTAPEGVATDSSGNVFVSGRISDNAFKIDTPGTCSTTGTPCTITQIIDSSGDGFGNTLDSPHGVATDSSGNVFVVGAISHNAFKITPGGIITEIIDSSGDGGGNFLSFPFGIATDSSGNVFVSGGAGSNVFKIDTPGTCSTIGTPCTITEIIDSTGDGVNTLTTARGIATDSSGNVFVSAQGSHNAFKIDTPGTCSTIGTPCTITQIIDSSGDGGGNPLDSPFGIATDLSGNVFVTGGSSKNVFEITPGGIITEIIDFTGDGSGTGDNVGGGNILISPYGVATDLSGNVFVGGLFSENAFVIILDSVDSDGDGVKDNIDEAPNDAANDNFSDGTTFGNIVSGNANLSITNVAINGVTISATGNGTVSVCGIATITFTTGDEVLVLNERVCP